MDVITFSPDLSIVRVGAHIFNLLAPGHPRLSFPDNSLNKLQEGESIRVTFSSYNRYLVFTKSKDNIVTPQSATYGVFRICRQLEKLRK